MSSEGKEDRFLIYNDGAGWQLYAQSGMSESNAIETKDFLLSTHRQYEVKILVLSDGE